MLNLFMWFIYAYEFSFYMVFLVPAVLWCIIKTAGPKIWINYRNMEGIIRIILMIVYEIMVFIIMEVIVIFACPVIVIIYAILGDLIGEKPSTIFNEEIYVAAYNETMDTINKKFKNI